jgi:hypothetical protein
MVSTQDASLGLAVETTYKTGVTPSRWYEFVDASLDFNKQIKQGMGLRVGGRVARSARRVVPAADAGGDFTVECTSKGMGLLWQACLGTGSSTLTSGSVYQQLFTLGDNPSSLTIQKGVVEAGLTVDAYTFLGCMVSAWEFDFPNADICSLKVTIDAGDLDTATSYASPSYATSPALFEFSGGTISTGTLTAPTSTTLASATTALADVRSGTVSCANNLTADRFNLGGGGRKSKPTVGLRGITGTLAVEYDSTDFRDAVLDDSPMCIVLDFAATAETLGAGHPHLQVVLPEVKFDSEIAKTNGTDLVVQNMSFSVLDNLSAAQPIWVVMTTADTEL